MANAKNISTTAATAAPASATTNGARVVVNTMSLDPKSPIPFEQSETWYTTRKGSRYIPFLNPSDSFPQLLLQSRLLSNTGNACVTTKVEYCVGTGWYLKDGVEDEIFTEWAKSLNRDNHTLNDILAKCFDSFFTAGNAYIRVIRGKIGSTKFVKVKVLNNLDCRLIPDDDDEIVAVAVTKDFRREGTTSLRKDAYEEFPLYAAKALRTWVKDSKGDQSLVIHLKNEMSGYDYYGMPSNVSGLPHQILEYKAARYNLDSVENNMVVGGLLVLDSSMTQEEADAVGRKIVQQHTGDGKRGRVIVLAGQSAGEKSNYFPFEKQEDGDYIEYDKHSEDKIITANQWDPILAGLRRESGLGNGGNAYIRSIFDIKNETVIKPAQKKILEKVIAPILEICDEWMGTNWADLPIGIRTAPPVSFAADIDVNAVTTRNEGREVLGMPVLEDGKGGDEFIKTNVKQGVAEGAVNVPA